MLRGARSNGGQVLLVSAKQNPKYAHLPPYVNTTCMFTDASLKKVINLRKLLGLEGPGNIGILRMRAENSSTVEKEENVINTEEEEVVDNSEPINESENVNVVDEVAEEKQEIVNMEEIAVELEKLLPMNDHTVTLLKEIDGIFTYVRKKVQHEEDFHNIQAERDAANELNKGLQKDVAEATAETRKVETERDAAKNQITALQTRLNNRGRDHTAQEVKDKLDENLEKEKNKIRKEPPTTESVIYR